MLTVDLVIRGSELQPPNDSKVQRGDYFVHHPHWQIHRHRPGKVPFLDPEGLWVMVNLIMLDLVPFQVLYSFRNMLDLSYLSWSDNGL